MASTKGLPVEIFLQVYGYLGPKDFNAARRTCRAWMKASLDRNLLMVMLERGGWTGVDASREWQWLSCQLARECALAPGRAGLETEAIFTKSSEVDFTGLRDSQPGGELIFTTSICSRFLCIAQEALIHIYQLEAGRLIYMVSAECQGRVLAITMGLYGGRYAIAAILEGRTGMVRQLPEELFGHGPQEQKQEQDRTQFNAIHIQSNSERISITGTNNSALHEHNLINQTWNLIENDSTIYSDLGSNNDPPRSVSLCPQSQCVVFGCSAGMDVQWIDESSGQSLHRWFSLIAPSDHVYFLPSRTEYESSSSSSSSSNSLRLISSTAHQDNRPSMKRRLFPNVHFHGSSKFESTSRQPNPTSYDHDNATPLSDGHHLLFVDYPSDHLVLGTTELVRKIEFLPPKNGASPRLYRVAADMSEGARIVVVYGDIIMLYSVPPSVCHFSPSNDHQSDRPVQPGCNHWLDWWDEPCANEETATLHNHEGPAWPLSLRDAGKCEVWKFPRVREAFGVEKMAVCQKGLVESDL
ncbi:hypothetical protein COCMIDRAFT_30237 [Bipolaris oryzae ATCC 44560]|uniref:F-box domain-containing protein n=1 Tax=Bipolaris oryzae ATCC 44560 TaxID=930090 RepID=W6YZE3_COCMI|nr:uncharacterized protein COCMIDRAFT_30237 [Bipolaris oryzae ATCC 44560]EUC40894.1 hypothetical protein COCMIDRAFT_30237 [Bipolaris oryzae ATCC 44560]